MISYLGMYCRVYGFQAPKGPLEGVSNATDVKQTSIERCKAAGKADYGNCCECLALCRRRTTSISERKTQETTRATPRFEEDHHQHNQCCPIVRSNPHSSPRSICSI